jgi:hypothetical protein
MTPHDTPAGPSPLRAAYGAWRAARTARERRDALLLLPAADRTGDFVRLLVGSPGEAAKLMQEVAPDDRR